MFDERWDWAPGNYTVSVARLMPDVVRWEDQLCREVVPLPDMTCNITVPAPGYRGGSYHIDYHRLSVAQETSECNREGRFTPGAVGGIDDVGALMRVRVLVTDDTGRVVHEAIGTPRRGDCDLVFLGRRPGLIGRRAGCGSKRRRHSVYEAGSFHARTRVVPCPVGATEGDPYGD
ncbi:MAG: hypothetical protein KC621_00960 [Myxococcales bacterium]|nr:hypothetical protein [Myxococcales bacterium]